MTLAPKQFHTFNGLRLRLEQRGEVYIATLLKDRVKVLYEGSDRAEALRVYEETKQHYELRAKEEG